MSDNRSNATAFRLWREASSVDWDCNATDLARACNVPMSTVRDIVRRRGWTLTGGPDGARGFQSYRTEVALVDLGMAARRVPGLPE